MTMAKVSGSAKLDVSAKQVWDLIGKFNALPDWHPAVEKSEIEEEEGGRGLIRRLHLFGGGTIVERLERLDETEHVYSYEILESPLPVSNYHATLRVREGEGGCTVEWSTEFEPKGAPEQDAIQTIQGIFDAGLENLKRIFGG
jgi:ribosome-associated toxin RatA of RatAB toxin-antitoxin module